MEGSGPFEVFGVHVRTVLGAADPRQPLARSTWRRAGERVLGEFAS